MKELIEKTSQWHHDRNLIDGATSKDQVLKLIQEVGELSDSVCKGEDVKDDIGDCLVILINIAEREGTTLEECLGVAYEDIKDRKGKMVDGIFVKEEK
jgi:NTP pyrophosphatase (non-canonical NTP hydrolase)